MPKCEIFHHENRGLITCMPKCETFHHENRGLITCVPKCETFHHENRGLITCVRGKHCNGTPCTYVTDVNRCIKQMLTVHVLSRQHSVCYVSRDHVPRIRKTLQPVNYYESCILIG